MEGNIEQKTEKLFQFLPDIRDSSQKSEPEKLRMIYEDILRFFNKYFSDKEPDEELIMDLEFLMRCTDEEPAPSWLNYNYIKNKFQGWIDYIKEPNYGNGPMEDSTDNK